MAGQSHNRFIYHQSLEERFINRVISKESLLQGLPSVREQLPTPFTYRMEPAPLQDASLPISSPWPGDATKPMGRGSEQLQNFVVWI